MRQQAPDSMEVRPVVQRLDPSRLDAMTLGSCMELRELPLSKRGRRNATTDSVLRKNGSRTEIRDPWWNLASPLGESSRPVSRLGRRLYFAMASISSAAR